MRMTTTQTIKPGQQMEIKGMNISPQYKDEISATTVAYKDMVFPAT